MFVFARCFGFVRKSIHRIPSSNIIMARLAAVSFIWNLMCLQLWLEMAYLLNTLCAACYLLLLFSVFFFFGSWDVMCAFYSIILWISNLITSAKMKFHEMSVKKWFNCIFSWILSAFNSGAFGLAFHRKKFNSKMRWRIWCCVCVCVRARERMICVFLICMLQWMMPLISPLKYNSMNEFIQIGFFFSK